MVTEQAGSSLVLMYHRMGSPLTRSIVSGQYVLPAFFRWQMHTLLKQGYRPIALREQLAQVGGTARNFSVTFDDGYASTASVAVPILREMQIPVTIFVVAGCVGKTNVWDQLKGDCCEPMMTAETMRELDAAGVEIGSHTMSHAKLTELSDDDLRVEIFDSKKRLEDILGKPVLGFSYPYGAWDARVRDAALAAGYQYATATKIGTLGAHTDPYAIPRINMRWNTVGALLVQKVHRAERS